MYPWEPFGYKTAWIAARDCSPEALAEALELTVLVETSPADAINGPKNEITLAVLPPVPGVGGMWTLATGDEFFDIDAATLAAVSARLGSPVQQFGTHRVSDYHLWMLADQGQLVRQYRFNGSDGVLEAWAGRPTPVEVELGLADVESFADDDEAWEGASHVNEETVMSIAAAWSVNPMELEDVTLDRPALVCRSPQDLNAVGRGHDPGGPTPRSYPDAASDDDPESSHADDDGQPTSSANRSAASDGSPAADAVVAGLTSVLTRLFGRH